MTSFEDRRGLQEDTNALPAWSEKGKLKFHPEKWKVMNIDRSNMVKYRYTLSDNTESNQIVNEL